MEGAGAEVAEVAIGEDAEPAIEPAEAAMEVPSFASAPVEETADMSSSAADAAATPKDAVSPPKDAAKPTSSDMLVELETVWETQQYVPFRGFGKPLQAANYLDARQNKLRAPPNDTVPLPPLPRGWRWAGGSKFVVDTTWGPVDDEGWTYATTASGFRDQMATGNAIGVKHANHFFRRRRWVRPRVCASKRVRRKARRHLRSLAADRARAEWMLREKEGWFQAARAFEADRRMAARAVRRDVRIDAMAADHRAEGGVRFLRQMGSFVKEKGTVEAEFAASMAKFVASQRAAEARVASQTSPAAAGRKAYNVGFNGSGEAPSSLGAAATAAPSAGEDSAAAAAVPAAGTEVCSETPGGAAAAEAGAVAVSPAQDLQDFQALPQSSDSGGDKLSSGGGVMEVIESAVLSAVSAPSPRSAAAVGAAAAWGASALPPHESFYGPGPWFSATLSMYESIGMLAGSFASMATNDLFRDIAALHSEYAAVRQAMTNEVSALWALSKTAEDAVQAAWARVEEAFSACCAAAAGGIQRLTDALHGGGETAAVSSISSNSSTSTLSTAATARADVWVEEQRYRAALLTARQNVERLGTRVGTLVAVTARLEAQRAALAQRVRRMLLLEESRVAADVSSLISTYAAELASPGGNGRTATANTAKDGGNGDSSGGTASATAAVNDDGDGEEDVSAAAAVEVAAEAAASPAYEFWSAAPPPSAILAAVAGLVEMQGAGGEWRPVLAVVTRDQFLHLFEAPAGAAAAAGVNATAASGAAPSAAVAGVAAAADAAEAVEAASAAPAGDALAGEVAGEATNASEDGNGSATPAAAAAAASADAPAADRAAGAGGSCSAAGAGSAPVDYTAWLRCKPAMSMDVGAAQATIGGGEGVYEVVGVVGKAPAGGAAASLGGAFGKRHAASARVVLRTAVLAGQEAEPIDRWIQSMKMPSAGMEGAAAAAATATAAAGDDDADSGLDDGSDGYGGDVFEDEEEEEEAEETVQETEEGFFDEDGEDDEQEISLGTGPPLEDASAGGSEDQEVAAAAVAASSMPAAFAAPQVVDGDLDDEITLEL